MKVMTKTRVGVARTLARASDRRRARLALRSQIFRVPSSEARPPTPNQTLPHILYPIPLR